MIWLQNLAIIIIGFLLSRILIEENIHQYFIESIFKKDNFNISTFTIRILFLSYFLSLFFPNTIVVITLIPVVKLILDKIKTTEVKDQLTTSLVLALIYGSNIGGMGSMIGASSSIYFLGYIELQKIPGRENISFLPWLLLGVPLTFVLLLFSLLVINIGTKKIKIINRVNLSLKSRNTKKLKLFLLFSLINIVFIIILSAVQFIKNPVTVYRRFNSIDIIFILYIFLFIFIVLIYPRGNFSFRRLAKNISELFINITLFPLIYLSELINEFRDRFKLSFRVNYLEKILFQLYNTLWYFFFKEKKRNIKRKNNFAYISISRIFYDLPFLGLTFMGMVVFILYQLLKIGDKPHTSELDGYFFIFIKDAIQTIIPADISISLLLLIIVFISIFFTEIISNTTIIVILFSLISTITPILHLNPLYLMLAVTIASTAAFMSPIASPVNAVAYASIQGVSLKQMFLRGLLLNIISTLWITIVFYFFIL